MASSASAPASPLDAGFAALADPTRRGILQLLRTREVATAGEIAAAFDRISRPAVSRHLRILREAALVRADEVGREWQYRLEPTVLQQLYREWFEAFEPLWDPALRRLKQRVEDNP